MMRLGDMNGTLYITTPINLITIITTSLTEENVQPLYDAADKYDVKDLQEECIFYMISSIRVNNAIDMMVFAPLYSIVFLEDEAIEFAVWNSSWNCDTDWFVIH